MYKTKKFLKNISDAKEQQYLMLREAIWKHMEAQRNITMFVVTSILAFYTIVFSFKVRQPYVFIMPLFLLLPFSYKELDHKISIAYIAAYQIVCLENNQNVAESFTWETDFFLFKKRGYDTLPSNRFTKLLDCEFLMLGIISFFMYIIFFIIYRFDKANIFCIENFIGCIVGIIYLFIIWIIGRATMEYNYYNSTKINYIKWWLKFMLDEKRIDLDTYQERYMELIGEID